MQRKVDCKRRSDSACKPALPVGNRRVMLLEGTRFQAWNSKHRDEVMAVRCAEISRKTNETEIAAALDVDGTGKSDISTGIGFFDHMLDQLSRHSLIDMKIEAKGDLHIDDHHTVEDTGIVIGQALAKAL